MIIGTNFKLSSEKFLDDRQMCESYEKLVINEGGIIYPPGFEVFCVKENKYYQYILNSENYYTWEERKGGTASGSIGAVINDETISSQTTWSSEHIDSIRMDLEVLITQAEDYTDEVEGRVGVIEGQLQLLEDFDGTYESLIGKPFIPSKLSELENDTNFVQGEIVNSLEERVNTVESGIENKVDREDGKTLIDIQELNRLASIENYDDTTIRSQMVNLEVNSHTHENQYVLDVITQEQIDRWNGSSVVDYNYLVNTPIIRIGIDVDMVININDLSRGAYLIRGIIDERQFNDELCLVEVSPNGNIVEIIMMNSMKKITLNGSEEEWAIVKEEDYGIDKNNAKISNSLNIGEGNVVNENNQIVQGKFNEEDIEGKYINIVGNGTDTENRKNIHTLDWEGNGWYGGKLSQEGTPTENKDLVTKGYVDDKFATKERVDIIEKENTKRDVIIEALANGRRRTVESNGNDVDLLFSTERDTVWIDKIEGRTLVNVCDQKEPVAITKSYTVENENHIPLQGEYDGKARPVVYGNTLVNRNIEYNESLIVGKEVNRQGTEILNIEGTKESEVSVKLEGHTAINLATKKGGELCRTFPNASGNKIDLTTDKNSRTDVVLEGNTMVNLAKPKLDTQDNIVTYTVTSSDASYFGNANVWIRDIDNTKTHTIILNILENTAGTDVEIYTYGVYAHFPFQSINIPAGTTGVQIYTTQSTQYNESPSAWSCLPLGHNSGATIGGVFKYQAMIFEGDLTQTPELIPTEYVEGLQSTFEDKLIPYSIYNGDNLTSITETQYQLPLTVKPNTQYTVTTTANTTKYQYAVYSTDGLTEYLSYDTTVATQTFTCDTSSVYFKVRMNPSYEGDDYSFVLDEVKDKFLIVEGDWSGRLNLLTEEYFGKYRVDMSSHGKNLIDINNPNVHLVKDKIYTIWFTLDTNSNTGVYLKITNKDGSLYTDGFNYHASPNDFVSRPEYANDRGNYEIYGRVIFSVNKSCYITKITNSYIISIQLEEGSTATEYEPYCGTSKTIYLNSPLLDGDELVMKDGKLCHYHKMGMIVLDGSEDEGWVKSGVMSALPEENTMIFCTNTSNLTSNFNGNSNDNTICDNFVKLMQEFQYDYEQILFATEWWSSTRRCAIRISKSKLSTTDLNGFKQWLSENPTTVVYELAEPWYEPLGGYGKVVLDGSEDWTFNHDTEDNIAFYTNTITDLKLNSQPQANIIQSNHIAVYDSDNLVIVIAKSKLSTVDADGFKQWLKENPVTVIYELTNPQPITEDMIFDIATTSTLEYQSSVPMANTTFKQYINELNLLESSTQYRVIFDCDVEGLALEVSLGGTSQVIDSQLTNNISFITPSLQTNGRLIINGSGMANIDNVRITKGEMVYPYFEGLKSSFENRYIKGVGELEMGAFDANEGYNISNPNCLRTKEYIEISQNTYKIYSDLNYNFVVAYYDKNKIFISQDSLGYESNKNNIFTTPSNCSYIKIRSYAGNHENNLDVKIYISTNIVSDYNETDYNNSDKYVAKIKLSSNDFYFGKGGRL